MAAKIAPNMAIFDLDGTLVDTAADLAAAVNHALGLLGLNSINPHSVRGFVGQGARKMLEKGYLASAGYAPSEADLNSGLTSLLTYYEANIAVHSRPFVGAIDLVRELRRCGWRTAICTNKRERFAKALLKELRIAALFDAVVGADTAEAPKPDAAPVRLCMKLGGAGAGVFFGDSDTDILAARAAGLPYRIAAFGYGPVTLIDAAQLFASYDEITEPSIRKLCA